MSYQENLDEDVVASVNDETYNEEGGEDDNDSSTKKNTSNFKALYKSNKEKESLLAEKESELEKARERLKELEELNPEAVKEIDEKKSISTLKEEMFAIKNPDAEPYLSDIRKTMSTYNMDINEAWKFVKIDIPEESKTKTDFTVGKTTINKNTDFTKISPEDALELSKADQSKWRKVNGWE